jgi:ribosomal protein S30
LHGAFFGSLDGYQLIYGINYRRIKIAFMFSEQHEILIVVSKIRLQVPCNLDADKSKNYDPKSKNDHPYSQIYIFFSPANLRESIIMFMPKIPAIKNIPICNK